MTVVAGRVTVGTQVFTPSATVTLPGVGAITHGSQLTRAMCLPRVPLTTVSAASSASDFVTAGGTISGKHFVGNFNPDIVATVVDCQFDHPIVNNAGKLLTMQNCIVSPPTTPGDWCIGYSDFNATRCVFEGCSDGIRFMRMNIVECWIATKGQNSSDHNDAIQMYNATVGGSILRCNINGRPSNWQTLGLGYGNSCIFAADGSKGTLEVRDNLFTAGAFTLGFHESMKYRVTGNRVTAGSWQYGIVNATNAVSGAFLEWSDNKDTDGVAFTP